MDIKISVVGGTDKTVRAKFAIEGQEAGELQVERSSFTRLLDLLFTDGYVISNEDVIPAHN